jgi:hypothetical protein
MGIKPVGLGYWVEVMKVTIYNEEEHGGRYAMFIIDDGDGVAELNEDEIIELYNKLGSVAPAIMQRRAKENKGSEYR